MSTPRHCHSKNKYKNRKLKHLTQQLSITNEELKKQLTFMTKKEIKKHKMLTVQLKKSMMINNFYRVGRMKTVLRHETLPSSDRFTSYDKDFILTSKSTKRHGGQSCTHSMNNSTIMNFKENAKKTYRANKRLSATTTNYFKRRNRLKWKYRSSKKSEEPVSVHTLTTRKKYRRKIKSINLIPMMQKVLCSSKSTKGSSSGFGYHPDRNQRINIQTISQKKYRNKRIHLKQKKQKWVIKKAQKLTNSYFSKTSSRFPNI